MADTYLALKGFNTTPNNRRVEAGETVDDLTAKAVRALLNMGAIEPVAAKPHGKAR